MFLERKFSLFLLLYFCPCWHNIQLGRYRISLNVASYLTQLCKNFSNLCPNAEESNSLYVTCMFNFHFIIQIILHPLLLVDLDLSSHLPCIFQNSLTSLKLVFMLIGDSSSFLSAITSSSKFSSYTLMSTFSFKNCLF